MPLAPVIEDDGDESSEHGDCDGDIVGHMRDLVPFVGIGEASPAPPAQLLCIGNIGNIGTPHLDSQRSLDLPPVCFRLLEEFIEKCACNEAGLVLDSLSIESLNLADVGHLVSQSVLDQRRDELGGATLSLNSSALQVSGTGVASGPSLICSRALRGGPAHKVSKLELVQRLLHEGWECVGDAPKFFRQGERRVFSSAGLLQAKVYFQCLSSAQDIFAKPGAPHGIAHHRRRFYYQALLSALDLPANLDLGDDVLQSADADANAMLAEGGAAALAICGAGDEALCDDIGGVDLLDVRSGGAQVVEADPQPKAPVTSVADGMPHVTVHFDNYTHASGSRRAFVQCPIHAHCRRCIFVKSHASNERAVAWLVCWAWAGQRWPDRASRDEHMAHNPCHTEVDAAMQAPAQTPQRRLSCGASHLRAGARGLRPSWRCRAARLAISPAAHVGTRFVLDRLRPHRLPSCRPPKLHFECVPLASDARGGQSFPGLTRTDLEPHSLCVGVRCGSLLLEEV